MILTMESEFPITGPTTHLILTAFGFDYDEEILFIQICWLRDTTPPDLLDTFGAAHSRCPTIDGSFYLHLPRVRGGQEMRYPCDDDILANSVPTFFPTLWRVA